MVDTADAVEEADVAMVLLPDTAHGKVYAEGSPPPERRRHADVRARLLDPLQDGHPPARRRRHDDRAERARPPRAAHLRRGHRTPALVAVQQDATGKARQRALAYGHGIGAARAGIIETTFKEETETDLFGEQTVLCGGLSELIRSGFDTLVAAGYQPEIAYFECLHEVKLIVDLIYEGVSWMRHSISDTAEWGDYVSGPRVIDDGTREAMRQLLGEIQDGSFAKRWIAEADGGFPEFQAKRREARASQLEDVGRQLRPMMPWLQSEDKVPPS